MAMDVVHDTQVTYRKLLDSMSRPGKIATLTESTESRVLLSSATFLTVLTLFDAEVSFHVVSDKEGIAKLLSEFTFASLVPADEADYIIVPDGTDETEILAVMEKCKIGTMTDPQKSATWLIEKDVISNDEQLVLTGPGIKEQAYLYLDLAEQFWQVREEKTKEYPLGIDLIFTDRHLNLVCIPRTTNVSAGGEA